MIPADIAHDWTPASTPPADGRVVEVRLAARHGLAPPKPRFFALVRGRPAWLRAGSRHQFTCLTEVWRDTAETRLAWAMAELERVQIGRAHV